MMQEDLTRLLHESPHRGVLAITGGGSGAIERLLTTPGASATVLEAAVPYSQAALAQWLGAEPLRACDAATARAMAMRSFGRARELDTPGGDPRTLFGAGCTASLATDRPKRGEHRAYVAVQTAQSTAVLRLAFEKGRRSRAEEEQAVTHALLAALAAALGVHEVDLSRTPPGIEAEFAAETPPDSWGEVLVGECAVATVNGAPAPGDQPVCLFPGSFNPPHVGHERIAQIAAERTGRPVVYELSLTNVDKPTLDYIEVRERLESLGGAAVWLTTSKRFVEKARLTPGAVFAVGADTIERVANPRYYAGDASRRDEAVAQLAASGARFLVFGRVASGRFEGLDSIDLPPALRSICEGVPEAEFRVDISSTELRGG